MTFELAVYLPKRKVSIAAADGRAVSDYLGRSDRFPPDWEVHGCGHGGYVCEEDAEKLKVGRTGRFIVASSGDHGWGERLGERAKKAEDFGAAVGSYFQLKRRFERWDRPLWGDPFISSVIVGNGTLPEEEPAPEFPYRSLAPQPQLVLLNGPLSYRLEKDGAAVKALARGDRGLTETEKADIYRGLEHDNRKAGTWNVEWAVDGEGAFYKMAATGCGLDHMGFYPPLPGDFPAASAGDALESVFGVFDRVAARCDGVNDRLTVAILTADGARLFKKRDDAMRYAGILDFLGN